jgi:peptidoglycan/LPS O-acetylase OafA/YrhL
MKPEAGGRTYYPVLDGLRGVAILLVVFYHNFGFINYFFFGWLGVDLFFVLSGYLITDILLGEMHQSNALKRFYIRRVLRIFPLYYLSLVLFLLILPQFERFKEPLGYFVNHQGWMWAYLQNWLFIVDPPRYTDFLVHYWSLAVEEQFYILWPVAILVLRKVKRLLFFISLLLVLVLLARTLVWFYKIEDIAYFNLYTFSRIDGICIGCMVALIRYLDPAFLSRNRAWIVLAFAGLNFIFFFINQQYNFQFPYLALIGYTTFAMLFGLLVHEGVVGKDRVINALFNQRILKFFGKISYGFYLVHWPVYMLLNAGIFNIAKDYLPSQGRFNMAMIFSSLICTIAGIAVSLVSYHFFEKHFLRLKERFV